MSLRLGVSWTVLLVAAVTAAALAAGCTPATSGTTAGGGTSTIAAIPAAVRPAGVWFADSGRLVVAAFLGEDGAPAVTIWEPATDSTRTVNDVRVIEVEPAAARAWVVPATSAVSVNDTSTYPVDLAGDGVDGPPNQLQLLDLNTGKATAATDARWQRWDGPGKWAVYPEIDINKGGLPSALWFNTPKPQGNGFPIKLPDGVTSIDLVGWSHSGNYFAAVSAVQDNAVAGAMRTFASAPAGTPWPAAQGRVLIFRCADGTIVSSAPVTMRVYDTQSGAARVAWDPGRDVLWVVGSGTTGVGTLAPGGKITAHVNIADGLRGLDTASAWFAGVSPRGAVLTDGLQAFLLAGSQATIAERNFVADRYLPKAGGLSISAGANGAEVVTLAAPDGQTKTLAVSGPVGK